MSVYVTSDLHGYPFAEFKKFLKKAGFSDNDFLYILGDVIDRNGDGGVEMLCRLLEQSNSQLILGNHEAMLLSCAFVFEKITNESLKNITSEKLAILNTYMRNGGDVTLNTLRELNKSSPETVSYILDYLRGAPLYETVCAADTFIIMRPLTVYRVVGSPAAVIERLYGIFRPSVHRIIGGAVPHGAADWRQPVLKKRVDIVDAFLGTGKIAELVFLGMVHRFPYFQIGAGSQCGQSASKKQKLYVDMFHVVRYAN